MKKQRMVAVFLCLMLVVTAFPMLAMAEETTYDTMDAVVEEFAKVTDYNSYAYWSMTEKISSGKPGFTYTPHNATIDPEKGTYIESPDTGKMFRYVQEQYWSPLETNKRFVYFKAQVSETDKMEIYVEDTQGLHQHGSFTISATEFNETNFGGLYSAREGGAGTGMNEYLIINDYPAIVKLFVKGEITGGKWALAANAYNWLGNNENRGLFFTGTGWVKDVTLYEKTETYESLEEIAGETMYSMPSYERNTETTTATGERFTGPVGPAVEEGMVPVFRAKLDDESSSMRVSIRKPGETAATAISYEFTVAPEVITSNAPLTYLNGEFQAGTDYVDYALFATTTGCEVYAKSDNQFDGKWVHILTDTTAYSADTSYGASPAIWAMTGSFTVQNLKIYQTLEGYDTIEEVVGFEPVIATKRFDLTQEITDRTGFAAAPTGATVDAENGTLIDFEVSNGMFRYSNGQEYWSSLETGKRFAYFKAKAYEDRELEVFVQNVDGRPSRGSFKISATEFSESGFANDIEYSLEGGAGTDWVEYLLVSTNANYVSLYAKSPSLTEDKWVLACVASGWAGTTEKNNGLYFSGKGYVKEAILYEKFETYESLDAIAGEELQERSDYEISTETTVATGERFTGPIGPAITEGMISVVRAKLDDEASSMRVSIRKPGETSATAVSYEFTVAPDAITSNAALSYLNEEFKAGTDYVDYALFATTTECRVYARSDSQFDGKWVHVLTDITAYSADTSYHASPAIWAMTGSFTVNNLKIYQTAPPVETYDSIDSIMGFAAGASKEFDLTTSNYGYAASPAALEQGVGVNMNNGGYWRIGGNGASSLGAGKAIYFRAKAEAGKNTYIYLHIPDSSKAEAAYTFMLNENGIGTTDNNTHKAYCYEAGGSHVGFVPGTEFAEYLAIDNEDGTGLHIYARQDGLYDGKWVQTSRIVGYYPNLSSISEFYMTSNGTLSAVMMYGKNTYPEIRDILGYDVRAARNYDLTTSNYGEAVNPAALEAGVGVNMNNGGYWRVGGNGKSALGAGKAIYFRARAEEGKNTYIHLHIPDETKTEATYSFMLNENGIGTTDVNSHKAHCYEAGGSHVEFKPGTEFAEYLAVDYEDGTGLHIYARQDGLFGGEWIQTSRIVGSFPSLSSKSEFYMTTNGTLSAVKMYEKAEFYATIDEVVGESVIVTKTFDDFMRYTPNSTYSPLTNGAVTFNATACEDGKAFRVYIHDPNTEKNAYAFKITKDGFFKVTDNAPQNIVMSENFVPGTEAHDYLVVENQSKNGVLVYVKNAEGKWAPVLEITGHTLDTPYSDTYGLYIFNNEEGSKAVLHSAAIYTVANTEDSSNTIPEGATNLYFEDDFSGKREYKATKSGCTVEGGAVTIAESGRYVISGVTIPAGGYAEFKLTGNDITEFYVGDGASRFNWNLGSTDSAERIWRVVRSTDGTQYTGYWCPADNPSAWVKGFEEAYDPAEVRTEICFSNNGTGAITVDYLKVYVPDSMLVELADGEELTLIDGMGNLIMDIAEPSYKTTTILVKQDSDAKILLVAEHDNRGVLSKLTTQEVPAGENVTSLIYDAGENSVKVFLWDGLENITNLIDVTIINYKK